MDKVFEINRFAYIKAIGQVCESLGYGTEASHGFRWSHVQKRQAEMIEAGNEVQEALLINSVEHKHWRSSITNHYLG